MNIASVVNVTKVAEYAKTLQRVVYVQENLFSCSQDALEQLVGVIKEQNLNRVVIASCSPRTHEPLFHETLRNSGLNKYLFEQVNIRDQCSWVHSNDPVGATRKAKDLVRMAVCRAAVIEPLPVTVAPVTPAALVVGGGAAGMVCGLNLAEQGFKVHIIEAKERLGGHALKLNRTWKGENVPKFVSRLIDEVTGHKNIEVHLNAMVKDVSGLLAASDIGVLSSVHEGLSNAILEYMASGLPVVATDLPANREALGEDPRQPFCRPGDSDLLADQLRVLIDNEWLRREVGERNRLRASSEFSISAMCRSSATLINQLLQAC